MDMYQLLIHDKEGIYKVTERYIRSIADKKRNLYGRRYCFQGRVSNLVVDGNRITARVKGNRNYDVDITLQGDQAPAWNCTCPYNWNGVCKHVVATLYAVLEKQRGIISRSELKQETIIEEKLSEEAPKKISHEQKHQKWTKKIEKLFLPDAPLLLPSLPQQNWKLIYVLQDDSYTVTLKAARQKIRKDGTAGEISVLQHYDLNDNEHFDAIDKVIVPHLTPVGGLSFWKHEYNHYLSSRANQSPRSVQSPQSHLISTILQHLETKEVYLAMNGLKSVERIHVHARPLELAFTMNGDGKGDSIKAVFRSEGEPILLKSPLKVIINNPVWVLSDSTLYHIPNIEEEAIEYLERISWNMQISEETKEAFRKTTLPRLLERYPVEGDSITIHQLEDGFTKRIYLEERFTTLHVFLKYAYNNFEIPDGLISQHFIVAGDDLKTYYRIQRDLTAEALARRELLDTYMSEPLPNNFIPRQLSIDWIMQKLPVLVRNGFEVFGKENLKAFKVRTNAKVNVSISSGIDWFDVNMDIDYDGIIAGFKDIYQSIKKDERFVKLSDGTLGLIPEEWMKKFQRAFALTDAKSGEWKLSHGHFSLIDQLFDEKELHQLDDGFMLYRDKFRSFDSIAPGIIPAEFTGELRPYQKSGYDWLQFLKEFKFNGCLADDMGLGKTIQTLALLQHEYGNGAVHPSLIVVPTSIVFNWMNEGRRFTPSLDILCHTGNKRIRSLEELKAHDVIITSYGTLRRDIELMREMNFHYVILDESQNIKNPTSQNAKAVKLLNAQHRLSLTGTPVENNLLELWSQFDFLNPGLLGSRNSFHDQFVRPIERNKDTDAVEMLKKTIYPFILRRTKDVVAKELPPKTESVKYCDMEKPQRTLYNHWRDYYRATILNSIDTLGMQNSKFKVLEGLMKLRQICCHPMLVEEKFSGTSGKFEVWKEMVGELLAEGHKALIFSQFVKMLRVLSDHCDSLDVDYEYLDGQTRDREERVKRFQDNESVGLFLISLKAGGTGLNLTAADYVIHYDPWWNPAVEMQATDRTHRIGQTKNIFSYKLITKDTIEEKILLLQEKKKELVQSIITAETGIMKQITREDIEMLFE